MSGTLSLFNAAGKQWSEAVTLGSHQTQRIATNDLLQKSGLTGNYGGISFQASALASAIEAVHFAYDETSKFSASLELFSRDPNSTLRERAGRDAKLWTMRAPMLALGSPDPALGMPRGTLLLPTIFVRNATVKNIAADMALSWRGDLGKGQVKLPGLQLAPFATLEQLQIGALQEQLGIPDDAHWALSFADHHRVAGRFDRHRLEPRPQRTLQSRNPLRGRRGRLLCWWPVARRRQPQRDRRHHQRRHKACRRLAHAALW